MEKKINEIVPVEVNILKDGPIKVKGKFVFKDADGNTHIEDTEKYFCRCGGSKNKPFCDGTHKVIGVKN